MPTTAEQLVRAIEQHKAGALDQAEQVYREVLASHPENADALHMLGVLESQRGNQALALSYLGRAVQLNPTPAFYHSNLGNVLHELGRLADAVLCYEQALRLNPDLADAHSNLANTLDLLGRFGDSLAHRLEAVRLRPDRPESYTNLGNTLRAQGMLLEARACFDQALALDPNNAEAHSGLGIALLLEGAYPAGWKEYEWRWRTLRFPARVFSEPRWDGSPLDGRTILLYAEQGLGDTIQFLRYVPLVKQRGGEVVLECQPRLAPLARQMPEIRQVIPSGETLPAYDVQAPLLSLPRILGTTIETIPAEVPYLHVPAEQVTAWRARLGQEQGKKVGLVWAGSPTYKDDQNRSLDWWQLEPLFEVPDVRLFSLQRGTAASGLDPHGPVTPLEGDSTGVLDTAAAILNLDLVISVDSMTAHLAGALGAKVWTLLPHAPDWRWMLGRDDSPWYPTMRLFRQPKAGDWAAVVASVAEALRA
jgi:Flp pilus assembly protein TadD